MKNITFYNDVSMPIIGLGVFRIDKNQMNQAISSAYDIGYRHFDTAQMYGNEIELGFALKELKVNRADYLITTKIDNVNQGYESTLKAFQQSLKDLQTDYIDQLLIHWPGQDPKRTLETWKAFEKIYDEGLARVIGVSNFTIRHLQILDYSNVKPMSNQIERNLLQNENDIMPYLKAQNIIPIAWSPLGRGNIHFPFIEELAEKYNKTAAQIVLRWNIDSDVMIIPKSIHAERQAENFDLFAFELNQDEIEQINKLHTGERISFDPETYDF